MARCRSSTFKFHSLAEPSADPETRESPSQTKLVTEALWAGIPITGPRPQRVLPVVRLYTWIDRYPNPQLVASRVEPVSQARAETPVTALSASRGGGLPLLAADTSGRPLLVLCPEQQA
jgi:hypothetical protein